MLEGFRRRAGLIYSRVHFRQSRDPMIHFTNVLTQARRALVILPEASIDREMVTTLLRYLLQKFSSEEITVILRDDQVYSFASTPRLKTLTYSNRDLNPWFVPRRELVEKMNTQSYDVTMDLNMSFSLPSAFLCKASNAPLRVSFAKREGDWFYNFQVRTKKTDGTVRMYRNFLKCLEMF